MAVPELTVGVDPPVAEVADEEIAAEAAEAHGCPREAPRGVQLPVLCHAAQQVPRQVVDVDEPETLTGDLVRCLLVLLRVGDEDPGADRLDTEWPVPVGKARIVEPC